jgi:phosphoenolpyruvate carboxylase
VLELLKNIRIEPVFTAHPTESARRTMLRKNQRIAGLLLDRLDPTLTPQELRQNWSRVRTEITTAWQTEDHPRERLTVADEREHVVFYLAEILYRILPGFLQRAGRSARPSSTACIPSRSSCRTVGSLRNLGGRRHGRQSDVHAKTIRENPGTPAARSSSMPYYSECQSLAQLLSQSASRSAVMPELSQRIELYAVAGAWCAQGITPMRHDRMPYRVFLGQCRERPAAHLRQGRPNFIRRAAAVPARSQADRELAALPIAVSTPAGATCSG